LGQARLAGAGALDAADGPRFAVIVAVDNRIAGGVLRLGVF